MMTKWLQKRNCRVVKLPQVPVRLYADIYFILMLHQPLYNSCRDIKHYKCQYIWQNRGYFFYSWDHCHVTWDFFRAISSCQIPEKNNIWQDLTRRRKNKLQSDGFAILPFQRETTTKGTTKEDLRRLVQCWKAYLKTWMKYIHKKKTNILLFVSPLGTSSSFLDHVIRYFYSSRCQDADRIMYGIYTFPVSFTYLAWT